MNSQAKLWWDRGVRTAVKPGNGQLTNGCSVEEEWQVSQSDVPSCTQAINVVRRSTSEGDGESQEATLYKLVESGWKYREQPSRSMASRLLCGAVHQPKTSQLARPSNDMIAAKLSLRASQRIEDPSKIGSN